MNTDKERILMHIVDGLRSTQSLGPIGKPWSSDPYKDHVHFAPWKDAQPGDLVICETSRVNDYKIGIYKYKTGYSDAVIAELGTGRECNYSNERYCPIVGVWPVYLLWGDEYLFYQKVLKAFARGDEYMYRFCDISFADNICKVTIRETHGGFKPNAESIPFSIDIPWNKRMSVKRILELMREGGYGTHVFEYVPRPPAQGKDET